MTTKRKKKCQCVTFVKKEKLALAHRRLRVDLDIKLTRRAPFVFEKYRDAFADQEIITLLLAEAFIAQEIRALLLAEAIAINVDVINLQTTADAPRSILFYADITLTQDLEGAIP
jgi:hypothetical protein